MTLAAFAVAIAVLTSAESAHGGPTTFLGGSTTSAPPFPTQPTPVLVFGTDQSLVETLSISIDSGAPNSGVQRTISTNNSGLLLLINDFKRENYDYPSSYAGHFDGVGPGGERPPVMVVSQSFTPSTFDALLEIDLPNLPPNDPLFFTLHAQIGAGQPRIFTLCTVSPGLPSVFDLNITLADLGGEISPQVPVVEMQMSGVTTSTPEPTLLPAGLIICAVCARFRRERKSNHSRPVRASMRCSSSCSWRMDWLRN